MSLLTELRALFDPALAAVQPDAARRAELLALVRPTTNPAHGDYQANFAMPLAKQLGRPPQEVAAEVVRGLPANDLVGSAAVVNGFINITLSPAALARRVQAAAADPHLRVPRVVTPRKYVIDYSGPNVAKPLHVGHLRSTIIGDALVRLLRALGHTVTGDNHLGDWGTQFGILLYGYKHHLDPASYAADPVRELARLYVEVRRLAAVKGDDDDADAANPVMDACRRETAKLHAGDPENVALWQQFMPACLAMLAPVYRRLGVTIDHAFGESFYNPMLPGVVADLLARGLAVESGGAVVVPNARGVVPVTPDEQAAEEPPALIRKRDGAYTYTTTDLATIKYRADTFHPDEILYVVDARQALHFRTLFAAAGRWDYGHVGFRHVAFGSILGLDRKPLRTRDGGVVELETLLADAVGAAGTKYDASRADRVARGYDVPELTAAQRAEVAEATGIGAVKYADLSGNRTSDYVFNLDKMLATDGNTATYMQYAYARCRAIFRKGDVPDAEYRTGTVPVPLAHPAERALAVALLRLPETLDAAAADLAPHLLTAYLWDVAKAFSTFFEQCPVLTADGAAERASRLQLTDLTGRVIRFTLDLLGIRVVEQM